MNHLIVDGMLSGTGIRDAIEGGYVSPLSLGISSDLSSDLSAWVSRYEDAHYDQFADQHEVEILDAEGVLLSKRLTNEMPGARVEYFSSAKMKKIGID